MSFQKLLSLIEKVIPNDHAGRTTTDNLVVRAHKFNKVIDVLNNLDGLIPLGSKGDLMTNNGTDNTAFPIGADGFVLTADSAEAIGMKWAAVAAGTSFITLSDTPGSYGGAGKVLRINGTNDGVEFASYGLAQALAISTATGANDISITSGQSILFNEGSGGSLTSLSTAASRTWSLPDNSGTIALLSDITGGGHTIQEEGSSLLQRSNLDFQGIWVTATDGGAGPDSTIVTIDPNIPVLTDLTDAGVLNAADTFMVYNASATAHEEATMTQLQTYMQNNLTFTTNTDGIYDGNGTIPTTTVSTITDTWSLTGGDLIVDTDTLFVDASANAVGVNTASPATALHVVGKTTISDDLLVNTNNLFVDTSQNSVGIGMNPTTIFGNTPALTVRHHTSSGQQTLFVVQDQAAVNRLAVFELADNNTELDILSPTGGNVGLRAGSGTTSYFLANVHIGASSPATSQLSVTGTSDFSDDANFNSNTLFVDASASSVGIGTASPTEKLHVAGGILLGSAAGTADGTIEYGTAGGGTDFWGRKAGAWVSLTSAGGGGGNTIYSADDSLIGNRIVSQVGNTLSFTGTSVNMFSIDGTTFSVDGANNRIGIGTAAPAASAIVDITSTTGALLVSRMTTTQRDFLTASNGMIVYNTTTGLFNVREGGQWNTVGGIYSGAGSLSGNTTVSQGGNQLNFQGTAVNGFNVGGTTLSVDMFNGRVGIGTTSPTQKLQVIGGALISSFLDVGSGAFTTNTVSGKSGFNMGAVVPQVELQVLHSNANTSLDAGALTLADLPFTIRNTNSTAGNKTLINFQNSAAGGVVFIGAQHNNHTGDSDFIIMTNDGANAEKLRVDRLGNVGISQTSPAYKLDVTGDINSTTGYMQGGTAVVGARKTGWTDQTATGSKVDLGASPTNAAIASFLRSMYDDLKLHGLIGN